jgi:hypothetical protein
VVSVVADEYRTEKAPGGALVFVQVYPLFSFIDA